MLLQKSCRARPATPTSWFHVGNALLGYEDPPRDAACGQRGYHTKQ